jgi:hypothetical protein
VVDLGAPVTFAGFTYLPRQDQFNGRVSDYEFYVSADGQAWGEPSARGRFGNSEDLQTVRFAKPVTARFFRFRALGEVNGQPWTALAELDLLPVR